MTKETNSEMEVELSTSTETEGVEPEVENEQKDGKEVEINQEEENQEDIEPELEDFEFEGEKWKLPKSLKEKINKGVMMNADYTKKTQNIAEMRKKYEADQQNLGKIAEAQKQEFEAYAEVYNIDQQLAHYNKLDWPKIVEESPNEALKIDLERRGLLDQRARRLQEIAGKEQERSKKQQQDIAKLEEEAKVTLSRDIKNWGSELESSLTEFGKSKGFTEENLKDVIKYNPLAVKVLHEAYLYNQLKKQAAAKPKLPEPPAPVKMIKSNNSRATNALSDNSSVEDWLKTRNAQLRKQS